jgi:hypothetical protein
MDKKLDMLSTAIIQKHLLSLNTSQQQALLQIGPEEGISVQDSPIGQTLTTTAAKEAISHLEGIAYKTFTSRIANTACNLKVDHVMKNKLSSWLDDRGTQRLWLYGKLATTLSAVLYKLALDKKVPVIAFASRRVDMKGVELSHEKRLINMVYSLLFQLLHQFEDDETFVVVDVGSSLGDLEASMKTMPAALKLMKYFLGFIPQCIVIVDGWQFLSNGDDIGVDECLKCFLELFHRPSGENQGAVDVRRLLITTPGAEPALNSLGKDCLDSLNVTAHVDKGLNKLSTTFIEVLLGVQS